MSKYGALAALREFLMRRPVPPVRRGEILGEAIRGSHPEEAAALRDTLYPESALLDIVKGRTRPSPDMQELPLALRWELRGRDKFQPGVGHYDVTGGSALSDIIRIQPVMLQGEIDDFNASVMSPGAHDDPHWLGNLLAQGADIDFEDPVPDLFNLGQIRAGNLLDIKPDQVQYIPDDPFLGSYMMPDVDRPLFYVNRAEGDFENARRAPSVLKPYDILNDPDLRRELNLSLAIPDDHPMVLKSKVFKARGGAV